MQYRAFPVDHEESNQRSDRVAKNRTESVRFSDEYTFKIMQNLPHIVTTVGKAAEGCRQHLQEREQRRNVFALLRGGMLALFGALLATDQRHFARVRRQRGADQRVIQTGSVFDFADVLLQIVTGAVEDDVRRCQCVVSDRKSAITFGAGWRFPI